MTKPLTGLDIAPQHYQIIRSILKDQVPDGEVWAFGSRVKGRARTYSDLDLAINTKESLELSKLAELKERFSESDLPWKVDVVDWTTTSSAFRRVVGNDRILIQQGRPPHPTTQTH